MITISKVSEFYLYKVERLKSDGRPWVQLAAWDAYQLVQQRLSSEKQASAHVSKADSLLRSNQWSVASVQYESAFEILKDIIRIDSVKIGQVKWQRARCQMRLKRPDLALDDLKIAFEYNPTLRDTLTAEMARPENEWKALEGNRYLRQVLLKQ